MKVMIKRSHSESIEDTVPFRVSEKYGNLYHSVLNPNKPNELRIIFDSVS